MRWSDELTLIDETVPKDPETGYPAADGKGNPLPLIEARRTIYCNMQSVGYSEAWSARQAKQELAMKATIYAAEYHGERIVEIDGARYHVERTYQVTTDRVELTLSTQRKVSGGSGA